MIATALFHEQPQFRADTWDTPNSPAANYARHAQYSKSGLILKLSEVWGRYWPGAQGDGSQMTRSAAKNAKELRWIGPQMTQGWVPTELHGGASPRFCTRLPPPPSRSGPKAPWGGGGGGGGGIGGGVQGGAMGGGVQGGAMGVGSRWGNLGWWGGGGTGSRYLPLPSLWGES